MITRVTALLAAILIGGVLAPLDARSADKSGVYGRVGPSEIGAALSNLGFTTTRYTKRTDNTPELMGTVDGLNYSILFYRCDESDGPHCAVYQYWAKFTGLSVTPEQINKWNRDTWLGVAYLSDDGGVRLVITQRVQGGTTAVNIASVMADWRAVLAKFTVYIGFKRAGT